jgi:VanZ family protein
MKTFYITSLRHRYVYLILSVLFGLLLLYISTLPYSKIKNSLYPEISDLFDMINHFLGFTLFNLLLLSSFLAFFSKSLSKKVFIIYFTIAFIWGLLCEVLQYFMETRKFQFIDILANTSPSLIVPAIVKKVFKKDIFITIK